MRPIYAMGRFLFGSFFLYSGINHFQHSAQLAQYAAAKQVPNPDQAVKFSGALLAASGASLAFGLKPRLGALGIVAFLAAASPSMHDFWNQQDAGQEQNERIHFSKNMAMLGAALALLGAPPAHGNCRKR